MTKLKSSFLLIPLILSAGLVAYSTTPTSSVSLGTKKLKGGLNEIKVDASAIPSGGGTMVGVIINDTGLPMTDVTVSVVGEKTAPNKTPPTTAPTSTGGSTVTVPGSDPPKTSSGNHGPRSSSDGYTTDVDFTNSGGAGSLAAGKKLEIIVHIGNPGTAGVVKVWMTPSTENKPEGSSMEADVMRMMELTVSAPGVIAAMTDPGHDRSSTYVQNGEDTGKGGAEISAFTGSCTSLPAGVTLSSVHLQDPSASFAQPSGTVVTIDGSSFLISGFTALGPGETYEIVVVLSGAPDAAYKLMVDATF